MRILLVILTCYWLSACGGGGGGGGASGSSSSQTPATFSIKMCNPSTTASTTEVLGYTYDSGGSTGNYSVNQNCSLLIQPTSNPGSPLRISFSSFNLDASYDFLKIYDGTSAAGTALHTGSGFTGATLPANLIATSGAFYIVMTTDASVVKSGFKTILGTTPNIVTSRKLFFVDNFSNFGPIDYSNRCVNEFANSMGMGF